MVLKKESQSNNTKFKKGHSTIQIRGKLRKKNISSEPLKPYLRLDRNQYEQINFSSENPSLRFLRLTATSISEIQKCAEVGPDKRYAFFESLKFIFGC